MGYFIVKREKDAVIAKLKKEKEELNKLGADMVFFEYTKERSSTMIREEIKRRENAG